MHHMHHTTQPPHHTPGAEDRRGECECRAPLCRGPSGSRYRCRGCQASRCRTACSRRGWQSPCTATPGVGDKGGGRGEEQEESQGGQTHEEVDRAMRSFTGTHAPSLPPCGLSTEAPRPRTAAVPPPPCGSPLPPFPPVVRTGALTAFCTALRSAPPSTTMMDCSGGGEPLGAGVGRAGDGGGERAEPEGGSGSWGEPSGKGRGTKLCRNPKKRSRTAR